MLHGGLFLVNTALRRKLQTDIECHSALLFVHHHIRYFKHGGQVVFKIDHAAVAAGEGHEGNIVQGGQLFKTVKILRFQGDVPEGIKALSKLNMEEGSEIYREVIKMAKEIILENIK